MCLPDDGYGERLLEPTTGRLDAIRGARVVVLFRYMAEKLAAVYEG